jgi:hypothetical protein
VDEYRTSTPFEECAGTTGTRNLREKKEESSDKDLKFTTAEEDMNQEFKD